MSAIRYNGVVMYDALTDGIEYNVEYDKTGVDPIGVRIRATYTGVVHQANIQQIKGNPLGIFVRAPRRPAPTRSSRRNWGPSWPRCRNTCSLRGVASPTTSTGKFSLTSTPQLSHPGD